MLTLGPAPNPRDHPRGRSRELGGGDVGSLPGRRELYLRLSCIESWIGLAASFWRAATAALSLFSAATTCAIPAAAVTFRVLRVGAAFLAAGRLFAVVFRAVVFRAAVFRAVVFRAVVFRAVVFRAVVFRVAFLPVAALGRPGFLRTGPATFGRGVTLLPTFLRPSSRMSWKTFTDDWPKTVRLPIFFVLKREGALFTYLCSWARLIPVKRDISDKLYQALLAAAMRISSCGVWRLIPPLALCVTRSLLCNRPTDPG